MLSREAILEKMQAQLSAKRFKHCLGVEAAARNLAQRYAYADIDKAGLAGLMHDYAKELPEAEFLRLIDENHLDPDLKLWGNNVWHGLVGWCAVRDDLAVDDPEILHAIETHTVGSAKMSLLDKIVYVADYIEENRDFDGVAEAREIAQQSLDKAVAYETARTVEFLAAKHLKIYPQTLDTYNAFVGNLEVSK